MLSRVGGSHANSLGIWKMFISQTKMCILMVTSKCEGEVLGGLEFCQCPLPKLWLIEGKVQSVWFFRTEPVSRRKRQTNRLLVLGSQQIQVSFHSVSHVTTSSFAPSKCSNCVGVKSPESANVPLVAKQNKKSCSATCCQSLVQLVVGLQKVRVLRLHSGVALVSYSRQAKLTDTHNLENLPESNEKFSVVKALLLTVFLITASSDPCFVFVFKPKESHILRSRVKSV